MNEQKENVSEVCESFTNFESLYNYLENNIINPHEAGNFFQKLRDLKHKENNPDDVEKAQWEMDFFNFVIRDGKIFPHYSGTNKGEVFEYPNLNSFNEKTYNYLIERLKFTNNPILKSYYANILWCSPKKHTDYAEISVDSYLELVKIYERKDIEEPKGHFGLYIINSINNAHSIASQINYKIEELKLELKRLIKEFNFESSNSFTLRRDLIELMLENKNIFSKEDFTGLEKVCLQVKDILIKEKNIHPAIEILELGEKIEKKTKQNTYNWRKEIAGLYEILMKQAEEQNNSAFVTFCQYALKNYKIIKDEEKVKELEKKYSELEKSMKLTEFKTEVDLTEHIKGCKDIAENIIKETPEDIIKILMLDKNLLPQYKDMEKIVEEQGKEFVLQSIFPTVTLDQYGHYAQHFSDEEEKKYFHILQQYNWDIKLNKIHLIREIFFSAIRENKLSTEIILKFLNTYSWFGKNLAKKVANDKTIQYNWLNLIAPSINEYFTQMYYYFLNPNNIPNFVLCIDSLVLKFEGLLRDMCEFAGVSTFCQTQNKKGKNIVREKDIHALLYEEKIKELFNEDDLLFFKFLLVEKAGYNLRHKIAHSLMFFQEYNIDYMHLLILALLKLGKYDFASKE